MLTKNHTAWKKNRKLGDIWGGRMRLKLEDNIFKRLHSLSPPSKEEKTPIYMVDNPSRDFYFPVAIDDINVALDKLPPQDIESITHIWLRKTKKSDYLAGKTVQGCFVAGSGVYLIILYPFPKDNRMRFGKNKPLDKILSYYKGYTTDLRKDVDNSWYLQWTKESIKRYYLESLLLHEVGHCTGCFNKRFWSKASRNREEKHADNYAAVLRNKK